MLQACNQLDKENFILSDQNESSSRVTPSLVSNRFFEGSVDASWIQKIESKAQQTCELSWVDILETMRSTYIQIRMPELLQRLFFLSGSSEIWQGQAEYNDRSHIVMGKNILWSDCVSIYEFTTKIKLSIEENIGMTNFAPVYLRDEQREIDVLEYFELSPSRSDIEIESAGFLEFAEVLDGDFEYGI